MKDTAQANRLFVRGTSAAWGFALLLFFVLALAGYLVMQQQIAEQKETAETVSRSATQRMFSQRAALLALSLVSTSDPALRGAMRRNLAVLAAQMQENLEQLTQKSVDRRLRRPLSRKMRSLYFEPPADAELQTRDFVTDAQALASAPDDTLSFTNGHLQQLTELSTNLLQVWGQITDRYRLEGEAGIAELAQLELLILIGTLTTIAAAGCFVFRPMTRRLQQELTRRAETEQELIDASAALKRHAADLERSNRELEQFAGTVAHDLRSPLATILTFGRMLRKRSAGRRPEDDQLVEHLEESAQRMDQLVRDLLSYARVSSKAKRVSEVPLEDLIAEIEFDLQALLQEAHAQIEYKGLPVIHADRSHLRQLFQNLIENSLKFRHPHRPPVVRISARETTGRAGKRIWRVILADNGVGFDPRNNERVFEIFKRLPTSRSTSGLGLGLALCKRIVEQYDARITADGIPDEGTRFILEWPAEDSRSTSGMRREKTAAAG